ncbi:helix-turn-helix transcriptional regulator [Ideonella sp. BN130291]|uniref:helix-turn-helix transcriptional regulator n=1 Tax=Ideonella sp. BN130291 TaxID=3112940 RepID=UPI002E25E642|nr:helix-turn-helix transcriptional regulator [Ideonella sp. BN130291]
MSIDLNRADASPIAKTRRDPGAPRGVLRRHLGPGTFRHDRLAPGSALADWLEHFWCVRWDMGAAPPQVQETLPHPNVHLVVEAGRTAVWGVHEGRFRRELAGCGLVFGVKFKAGAFRPWFGRPVSQLVNRSASLAEVFGGACQALETQVLTAGDMAAMAATMERFLRPRCPPPNPQAAWVAHIVAGIVHDRDLTRVEALAQRCGVSPRALQRLFNDYVGIGPKWVIKRYRMHDAIERLQHGAPVDWPALAQELGYFDQAHFIRDFKRLVGRTPAAYARAEAAGAAKGG